MSSKRCRKSGELLYSIESTAIWDMQSPNPPPADGREYRRKRVSVTTPFADADEGKVFFPRTPFISSLFRFRKHPKNGDPMYSRGTGARIGTGRTVRSGRSGSSGPGRPAVGTGSSWGPPPGTPADPVADRPDRFPGGSAVPHDRIMAGASAEGGGVTGRPCVNLCFVERLLSSDGIAVNRAVRRA